MQLRPHRALIALLLTFATLATIAGAGARWIDHQLLSVPRWTATSNRLTADPAVRRAISGFAVQRAFGSAGIDSAIDHALPGSLATRATGALHGAGTQASQSLLSSAPGRRLWRMANHQAVSGLLAAVDHPARNQGVMINLTPLLSAVLSSVADTSVAREIPGASQLLSVGSPDVGRLVLLDRSEVSALRPGVRVVRTLAWALPLAALAAFLLCLGLARGWRSVVLSRIGYRLLIAGGILLGARALAQYALADLFVNSSADRAGVRAAWLIGSSVLRTEAIWLLIAGAVVTLVSWGVRAVVR